MIYRLNYNLTGVNSNTDLKIWVVDACHPIMHRQCRKAATDCVIFMGLWGAEERHDFVTLRFVDDAIIANNGFIHEIQNGL